VRNEVAELPLNYGFDWYTGFWAGEIRFAKGSRIYISSYRQTLNPTPNRTK